MDKRRTRNEHLEKEIKKSSKESFIKGLKKLLIILLIIIISILLYSRFIATTGLIVREHKYTNNKLPKSTHGLKVVHFSDLHYKSTIHEEELNNIVKKINILKPDLVLFTGDLLDKDQDYSEDDKNTLAKGLNNIKANLGKYIITGNHDYQDKSFSAIIAKTDFNLLDNTSTLVYNDLVPIRLVGISTMVLKKGDIDKAFNYTEEDDYEDLFTIVLFHEPDYITNIMSKYDVNLALAGHSHNGQVRLPYINDMLKPISAIYGAKKYNDPHYKINDVDLYISGGIGTSRLKLRLFNRPSFNLYRFQ